MNQSYSFLIGLVICCAIVAGGIYWVLTLKPKDNLRPTNDTFREEVKAPPHKLTEVPDVKQDKLPDIVPNNLPVISSFAGDLQTKGNPVNDGTVEPFVVGESLKLEAVTHNAVEYRWSVNGKPIPEKGLEWSIRGDRFFDVDNPGDYVFALQVRGADKNLVSQEKQTALKILPLKIMHFTKAIVHDDDEHFLTNDTINLQVEMATSMKADLDFYRYRFFINDQPVKNPEDEEEWSTSDSLSYTFAQPGNYSFKVEVRRADAKEAEDAMELPETVVAADAVLLSFDSNPGTDKGAPVGAQVYFSAFPTSRFGKSECRVGLKKINAADFGWLPEETGAVWGDPYRTWVPIEPGTYLVRCEIRELGKASADDFREMVFTVTDGNF